MKNSINHYSKNCHNSNAMRRFFIFIVCCCALSTVHAQDETIFSQYYLNPILINPAVAGTQNAHQLQLNARGSWTGFVDAPRTYSAMYNGPIGKTFGLGIGVLTETAAQLSRVKAKLNYSFRFKIKENFDLSAGFATEYQQITVDNSITEGTFFQAADRVLEEFLDGKGVFDASVGVFANIQDRTQVGLSFANLVSSRLDDIVINNQQNFFKYFTFFVAHEIEVLDLNFKIQPSIFIRQILNAPSQVDLNLKASFLDDQLITGLSYRSLGSMGVLLGTKLTSFYLYYSYDVSFQQFQQFNMGSHEVTLAFSFTKKSPDIDKGY